MEINIDHGIPKSPYFFICYPHIGEILHTDAATVVVMKDPDTGEINRAEVCDTYTLDEKNFDLLTTICLVAYGCKPEALKRALLKKYPKLKDEFKVRYWLLKKIS